MPRCRFSCSSFSSSSFSSSSGPQSGRSAPFTVSAPRPRPPRAAAGRGPPARPAPPHSGGAGLGLSRPARVAESAQGAGEGTGCAVAAVGPPSCAGLGVGGIAPRHPAPGGRPGQRRPLLLSAAPASLPPTPSPPHCPRPLRLLPSARFGFCLRSHLPLVFPYILCRCLAETRAPLTTALPGVSSVVGKDHRRFRTFRRRRPQSPGSPAQVCFPFEN